MTRPQSPFRRAVEDLHAGRTASGMRGLRRVIAGGGNDAAWACQELVQALLRRGDAEAADRVLRELLPDSSPILWHGLGCLHRRLGRTAEALRCLERATRGHAAPWAADLELGWTEYRSGDRGGLDRLQRARRAFERRGDDWGLATALTHLGTAATLAWRLSEALSLFAEAADRKRRCGDGAGLSTVLYNTGQARFHCADHLGARRAFESALEVQQCMGFREGAGASFNGIGSCLLELGEPDRARDSFQRALRVLDGAAGATVRAQRGVARANLGRALLLLGRLAPAERAFRAAVEELGVGPGRTVLARALANLAEAHSERGRPELALQVLDEAAGAGDPGARAAVELATERARALLRLGEPSAAKEVAQEAVAAARRARLPGHGLAVPTLQAEVRLAEACRRLGEGREAERALRRAAGRVERLRRGLPSAALRMGLADALREVDEERVRCALAPGGRGARRAFDVSRRMKGREIAAAGQGRAARTAAERRVLAALDDVEAELRHLVAQDRLDASGRRRLRELGRRHAELAESVPGPAWPAGAGMASPATLSRRLGPDTVLVDFHVARDQTFAFVVHGGRLDVARLPWGERRLERAVQRLVDPLRRAGAAHDAAPWLDALDLDLAHRLYRALLRPLLLRLRPPARRLILVPDGPLHALPFALLVTDPPGDDGPAPFDRFARSRYLVDDLAVATVPSALLLSREPRRPAPATVRALALSPPGGTRVQGAAGPRELPPLPGAVSEARRVVGLFPEGRLRTGRRATWRAIAATRSRGVLHVAAHALSDTAAPGLSGLVLSDGAGGLDFVTAERIARASLRADLVALSACATAAGRVRRGEGALGLARSFLLAGARAVLATHWPVDDHATSALVAEFYGDLLVSGDRAGALQRAAAALRARATRRPELAHPFYWAGFSLVDRDVA